MLRGQALVWLFKFGDKLCLNKIINNLLTKMFFCAALVLLFIIKLRFPKGKNIHHTNNFCGIIDLCG